MVDKGKYRKGRHPNSLKNLRKHPNWKPGQSGNPAGRKPNEHCFTYWLKQYQDKTLDELKEMLKNKGKLTAVQAIVLAQLISAISADQKATEHIWERIEGRIAQQIQHAGKVEIEVKRDGG